VIGGDAFAGAETTWVAFRLATAAAQHHGAETPPAMQQLRGIDLAASAGGEAQMSTTAIHQPPYKTIIRALNGCIETCMDGEKGFAIAAAEVRDPMLKDLLMRRSKQRAENMVALQGVVAKVGSVPENEGTVRGGLHRVWMTAARIAYGRSDALFVGECIRGEKAAMRDYEAALHHADLESLPVELSSLLMEQYRTIRESLAELLVIASNEHARTSHEVRTIEMPEQTIVTMRTHTTLADLPRAMHEALETIARSVSELGVPLAIYHNRPFRPDDIDVEIGASVLPDAVVVTTEGISRRQLPKGTIAYTLHVGSYENIGTAYEALYAWLRQNGRSLVGPPREVYLVGPGDVSRTEDYRTEIQIPFE
jgi:uncharacterized protein (TIGR02284 family)